MLKIHETIDIGLNKHQLVCKEPVFEEVIFHLKILRDPFSFLKSLSLFFHLQHLKPTALSCCNNNHINQHVNMVQPSSCENRNLTETRQCTIQLNKQ